MATSGVGYYDENGVLVGAPPVVSNATPIPGAYFDPNLYAWVDANGNRLSAAQLTNAQGQVWVNDPNSNKTVTTGHWATPNGGGGGLLDSVLSSIGNVVNPIGQALSQPVAAVGQAVGPYVPAIIAGTTLAGATGLLGSGAATGAASGGASTAGGLGSMASNVPTAAQWDAMAATGAPVSAGAASVVPAAAAGALAASAPSSIYSLTGGIGAPTLGATTAVTPTSIYDLSNGLSTGINGLGSTLGTGINGLGSTLGTGINGLLGGVNTLGNTLGTNVNALGGTLGNSIYSLTNGLSTGINGLGSTLGNTLGTGISGLGNTLGTSIYDLNYGLTNGLGGLSNTLGTGVSSLGNTLGSSIYDLNYGLTNGLGGLTTGINGLGSTLGNTLGSGISGLGNTLGSSIYDLTSGLGSGISSLGNTLGSGLSNLGSGLGGMFSSGLNNLGSTLGNVLTSNNALSTAATAAGAALNAQAARDAAQTQADAQIRAAQIAADAAKFKPVGVTTGFGSSQFGYDANGNLTSAGYQLTPQMQAQRDALLAQSNGLLGQFQGAQAATAPMGTAAQRAMQLGQGYLATDPAAQAQKYYQDQMNLLAPQRAQDMAALQAQMQAQGRGGFAIGGGVNGQGAANPQLQALYNAQLQQNAQLAANATQGGMDYAKFGAGLVGTGGDLLSSMYNTQTNAFNPYKTALGGAQTVEGLGQNALDKGISLGSSVTAANANAGQLLGQGMSNAASTMAPANAYSPWGALLSGAGNTLSGYKFDPMTGKAL